MHYCTIELQLLITGRKFGEIVWGVPICKRFPQNMRFSGSHFPTVLVFRQTIVRYRDGTGQCSEVDVQIWTTVFHDMIHCSRSVVDILTSFPGTSGCCKTTV